MMNNVTTIRRVTGDEVESLIDIRLEALENHPVAFSADFEKELKRPTPISPLQRRVQNKVSRKEND